MFVRNGEVLGSIQVDPNAQPKPRPVKKTEPKPDLDPPKEPEDEPTDAEEAPEELGVPPRTGAGSGLEHWQTFLSSKGIEFSEDAGRNDLVELWDESGGE